MTVAFLGVKGLNNLLFYLYNVLKIFHMVAGIGSDADFNLEMKTLTHKIILKLI